MGDLPGLQQKPDGYYDAETRKVATSMWPPEEFTEAV
jgi:hypothetical protein